MLVQGLQFNTKHLDLFSWQPVGNVAATFGTHEVYIIIFHGSAFA